MLLLSVNASAYPWSLQGALMYIKRRKSCEKLASGYTKPLSTENRLIKKKHKLFLGFKCCIWAFGPFGVFGLCVLLAFIVLFGFLGRVDLCSLGVFSWLASCQSRDWVSDGHLLSFSLRFSLLCLISISTLMLHYLVHTSSDTPQA